MTGQGRDGTGHGRDGTGQRAQQKFYFRFGQNVFNLVYLKASYSSNKVQCYDTCESIKIMASATVAVSGTYSHNDWTASNTDTFRKYEYHHRC